MKITRQDNITLFIEIPYIRNELYERKKNVKNKTNESSI